MGNCFSYCCSVDDRPTYSRETQYRVIPQTSSEHPHSDDGAIEGGATTILPPATSLRSNTDPVLPFNLEDSETTPFLYDSNIRSHERSVSQQYHAIQVARSSRATIVSPHCDPIPSEKRLLEPYIRLATSKIGRKDLLLPQWYTVLTSLTHRPSHPLPSTPYLQVSHLRRISTSGSIDDVLRFLRDVVEHGAPDLLPVVNHYFQPLLYTPNEQR
jgi:hypothetical protein